MLLLFIAFLKEKIEYSTIGKYKFTLYAGQYNITCYGAEGGRGYNDGRISSQGGKGAMVTGIVSITGTGTTFWAFIGEQGKDDKQGPNAGGFNGGGRSGESTIDHDDGSGGGGGATDIRVNDEEFANRIMVAAGGSGGAKYCNGSPGGDLNGYYPTADNIYRPADNVNQNSGNANGVGGSGDSSEYTPGSGGGGGWRGGPGSNDFSFDGDTGWKAVAKSGSSYISGYTSCTSSIYITFKSGSMIPGYNSGNGKVTVTTLFECSSNCIACTSDTVCTQCLDGYYMHKNMCVIECPPGSIRKESNCVPCEHPCQECDGQIDRCTKCAIGYSMSEGTKCIRECPSGKASIDGMCKTCEPPCVLCSTSPTTCVTCVDGYVFLDGKCLPFCPTGTIKNGKACIKCNSQCATCYGYVSSCTSCNDGFYLHGDKCIPSCPDGYYELKGQCAQCSSPCKSCISTSRKCTTCISGYYLYANNCVISCPPGTKQFGRACL